MKLHGNKFNSMDKIRLKRYLLQLHLTGTACQMICVLSGILMFTYMHLLAILFLLSFAALCLIYDESQEILNTLSNGKEN